MVTPYLREDLRLLEGASQEDGSPGWLLYDPLRNCYFDLGLTAFRLLKHWRGGEKADHVLERVQSTGLNVTQTELDGFMKFLVGNRLTVARGTEGVRQLTRDRAQAQQRWFNWLIHHYLFIRIPLVRPDAWLGRALPWVAPLFNGRLRRLIHVLGCIGLLLALRQWQEFQSTFLYFFSWDGLALYGVTLFFVKAAHELGHAFVAKRRGCRVASMGIAFLVMFPFFYTDTTDSWRLRSHRERLSIVLAGMLTELHLALIATFLWSVLPDGPARSAAFFVATISWVTSLAINLSPFMRFDGYYALADWLRAKNLQPRAFALGRWKLRECLFGLGERPPEPLPNGRRRIFIFYAWTTWVYRFFLFIGIALLVYYFFFKALGIVLFVVEIAWFILLPMRRELQEWWKRRALFNWNRRSVMTVMLLLVLFLLGAVPWRSTLPLPAVLEVEQFTHLYSPEPAQVIEIRTQAGAHVAQGDALALLESPDLAHEASLVKRRLAWIKTRIDRRGGSREDLQFVLVLQRERAEQESMLAGLKARMEQLTVRAPFAGKVTQLKILRPGQWVSRTDLLVALVAPSNHQVIALAPETDLNRITVGAEASFIPSDGQTAVVALQVVSVDEAAITTLPYLALASTHGGTLATRQLDQEGAHLRPEQALYRVVLEPVDPVTPANWQLPGIVHVNGRPRSWLTNLARQFAAVLVRESGF